MASDTSVSISIVPVTLSWDRAALKLGAGLGAEQQAGPLAPPGLAFPGPGQALAVQQGDYSSRGNTALQRWAGTGY